MVVDDHQVADVEGRIHATRGVAYKECFYAQLIHYAFRKSHLFHIVTFIEVETSLHRHDVLAAQLAENQLSGMAFYCRDWEARNFAIWKFVTVSYF